MKVIYHVEIALDAREGETTTECMARLDKLLCDSLCGFADHELTYDVLNRATDELVFADGAERDQIVEKLWDEFGDLPMNPETETIEADFLDFEVGTPREDVWRWFDVNHSKGVAYLLYGHELEF